MTNEDILKKVARKLQRSKKCSKDLELQQFLVFDFFCFLLEDEILQAEYELEDIALIVLCFWNKQNKEKSEKRIQDLLYEPVQKNFFVHYGKNLERNEAYEFVFTAIVHALENDLTMEASFGDLHKKAYSIMDLCPQLPMETRNRYGLLSAIGLQNPIEDPALVISQGLMN